MSDPLVSVVVPVYNAGRHIESTLASAVGQSYRAIEVVVVDDGSTDDSADRVSSAMAIDNRIRVITQSNAGLAAARNAGIAASRGELIATLDADDLWHPDKLRWQVEAWEQNPGVGLVYCWSVHIDQQDLTISPIRGGAGHQGNVLGALLIGNFVGCGSVPLIPKSVFGEMGGYEATLRAHEDLDMYLRIAEQFDFALVPRVLVGYRQTGESMSDDRRVMEATQAEVMQRAAARRALPAKATRWPQSGLDFYLARKAWLSGERSDALARLARIAMHDPRYAVNRIQQVWRRRSQSDSSAPLAFRSLDGRERAPQTDPLWSKRADHLQRLMKGVR